MSVEHDIVLVLRDRSGARADQIVQAFDTEHLAAVLQAVLAADAVLCTDASTALSALHATSVSSATPLTPAPASMRSALAHQQRQRVPQPAGELAL